MNSKYQNKIKTGLLAYGMSGKVFHAPFISAHPGFELVSIVERHQKKAEIDYPGIISYDNIEQLLEDQNISLVIVNTPNNLHFEHIQQALLKGKHVLVEKPFTSTTAQAEELFRLADKMDKQILFYQNRRWDSDFLSVKDIVNSGQLGNLHEVHIRFDRYRPFISGKTFKETPIEASGLQYDLGPHVLDQIISLFGAPLHFHKVLGKTRPDTQVDDQFYFQLSYPNSLEVFASASMMIVDLQPAYVLHGSVGSLIKHRADVQETELLAGKKPTDPDYGIEDPSNAGILTTIDAAGNKSRSHISANPGNYLALFEAAYQSIENNIEFPISRAQVLTQLSMLEERPSN